MTAELLLTNIAQLVTPTGAGALRGAAMRTLDIVRDAAIAITAGRIVWCGRRTDWSGTADRTVDLAGRTVVPGLIDPHTHIVWGGDRFADFEARASGVPYETILAGGGGIRHTVAETNASTETALLAGALQRATRMIASGTTTIEVKSGYGATWEGESRELRVIQALRSAVPARVHATMLFHLPPRDPAERTAYTQRAIDEWIPTIANAGLASAVDVFIEREAFQPHDATGILAAARAHGLDTKAHVDQFAAIGGLEAAIAQGALSVDHLEASGAPQIAALSAASTVGVILPGVTLHLGLPAAPARSLIDAGAAVALGTDCNPGSSPVFSMSFALALGVRLNGLSPAEALTAATANAAAALGQTDVGRIAPGMCRSLLELPAGRLSPHYS